MAIVVSAPPALSGELALYHTTDPLLSNSPVLIFYGPAASIGATSSRIQVHIFTPAGCSSYSRLAISPTSPFWSAVSNLPREEQGDEVCRGLAFGLKKYFAELSDEIKKAWCAQAKAPAPAALFGDDHIAILATRTTRIENISQVVGELRHGFSEQTLSWMDVDVVMPPGSIKEPLKRSTSEGPDEFEESDLVKQRYGQYAEIITALGEPTFLPTSKLKRAPSKATSIGRSASFLKQQKENARKELCELLDTEASYVQRMRELRDLSQTLGADLKASSRQLLQRVFPPGLDGIVNANAAFFEALRSVVDSTEQGAHEDIEAMPEQTPTATQARQDFVVDTQGIGAVAKCFCDWFPSFATCYSSYLKAQAASAQVLRDMLRSEDSALGATLTEVGEQKLTSLLIEPVQRLPRYSLYIDNIAKQLPARHPALKQLLKARDIVSDICAQDDVDSGLSIGAKLHARVSGWPLDCEVSGRLIAVVDFVELMPPFNTDNCRSDAGILVLLSDGLAVLAKTGNGAVTARGFSTELESGTIPTKVHDGRPATPRDLRFVQFLQLSSIETTEGQDGRVLNLTTQTESSSVSGITLPLTVDSSQTLYLEGAYEGKASRFIEEMSKTRIEGRFSESEREGPKWEVRATDFNQELVGLHSAVFEDTNTEHFRLRRDAASSRIILDLDKHSQRPRAGQHGIRSVVSVSPVQEGLWRISIDSLDGSCGRENLPTAEVMPTIRRKLAVLMAMRTGIQNAAAMSCLLTRHEAVLRSLDLHAAVGNETAKDSQPVNRDRQHRSKSPVKMLSSLLSNTSSGTQTPSLLRKGSVDTPSLGSTPRMAPPSQHLAKSPSREGRPSSRDQTTPHSISFMSSTEQLVNPMRKLEDTLNSYLLALQARKGNIVGKSLKMRYAADELAVNELYNALVEDPNNMVLAAQASVDVLFAAFEKFLNVAWKGEVGQVVPLSMFQLVQAKAETMFPADFDEYFRNALLNLPPQNQRAFRGIMRLLADLLDGTGNDGDRGILTVAFLEVLVTEGNPHDYIALIDRFVDDTETYFGEPLEEAQKVDSFMHGHKRARSLNTGSLTSNTSSLRRKFGLGGLSRESSRSDQDSKVASVWRTLSKSTRGDASPAGSISKASLYRSNSTDFHPGALPKRPSSQDGPSTKQATWDDALKLTGGTPSSQNLATIGEHPSFIPTGPPKKKRRSSLSDLRSIQAAEARGLMSPPAGRRAPTFQKVLDEKTLPPSSQPTTPSSKNSSGRFGSATKETPRSRLPASFRRETSPGAAAAASSSAQPTKASSGATEERPKTSRGTSDEVVITARPTSNIPMLKPRLNKAQTMDSPSREGLRERADAGNAVKRPSPSPEKGSKFTKPATTSNATPSTKRLRMQSPQKLRERLQNEQSAAITAQNSIQDELSKIGDELTSSPSRIGSVRSGGSTRPKSGTQPSNVDLAARVLKMEGHIPRQFDELSTRINTIQNDLASSLTVSESKCKKLDDLYREANAENEALYNRFNDELGKILKAVRAGEGAEEVKKKLKESQEEAAKLRRETQRLKRENVGLRAQLKE